MKVKTIDQLHITSVGPDTIPGGTTIKVSDSEGAELVKRGLVTEVAGKSAGGAKQAQAPKNKKAAAPRNKAR